MRDDVDILEIFQFGPIENMLEQSHQNKEIRVGFVITFEFFDYWSIIVSADQESEDELYFRTSDSTTRR
jgi:hypothetical protein